MKLADGKREESHVALPFVRHGIAFAAMENLDDAAGAVALEVDVGIGRVTVGMTTAASGCPDVELDQPLDGRRDGCAT